MEIDTLEPLLRDWGRRRSIDGDVSLQIFGANSEGWHRMNAIERIRRDKKERGRQDERENPAPREEDPQLLAVDEAVRRVAMVAPECAQALELKYAKRANVRQIAQAHKCSAQKAHATLGKGRAMVLMWIAQPIDM